MKISYFSVLLGLLIIGCGRNGNKEASQPEVIEQTTAPRFNADSAYSYIDRQVAFGPRIPNTISHDKALEYYVRRFKEFGASVYVQEFEASTFDRKRLQLKNIVASFNPDKQKRILLAAHWDTRPFADKDPLKKDKPFAGADDGGSGVGVLLEIARQVGRQLPDAGVDIILFDGEDWGEKENQANRIPPPEGLTSWWCLGSQYWSKHKHKPNYSAYYGILLDMVGAKGARFYREGASLEYAPKIVEKVWNTAEQLGYANYFIKQNENGLTDDHLFVNQLANIPMIDIINSKPGIGFGEHHHSQGDNMSVINKATLRAVGQTLLEVIYREE
jgi:glutaminyl-peptide cyclotransferase